MADNSKIIQFPYSSGETSGNLALKEETNIPVEPRLESIVKIYRNPDLRFIEAVANFLERNSGTRVKINGMLFDRGEAKIWLVKSVGNFIKDPIKQRNVNNLLDRTLFSKESEFLKIFNEVLTNINAGIYELELSENNEIDKKSLDEVVQVTKDQMAENEARQQEKDNGELEWTADQISVEKQMELIRRNAELKLKMTKYGSENIEPIKKEILAEILKSHHYDAGKIGKQLDYAVSNIVDKVIADAGYQVFNGKEVSDEIFQSLINSQETGLFSRDGLTLTIEQVKKLASNNPEALRQYYEAKTVTSSSFYRLVKVYENSYGLTKDQALKAASGAERAALSGVDLTQAYINGFKEIGYSDEYTKSRMIAGKDGRLDIGMHQRNLGVLGDRRNYSGKTDIFIKTLGVDPSKIPSGKIIYPELLTKGQVSASELHARINDYLSANGQDLIGYTDLEKMLMNDFGGITEQRASGLRTYRQMLMSGRNNESFYLFQASAYHGEEGSLGDNYGDWVVSNGGSYEAGSRPSFGQGFANTMNRWSNSGGLKGFIGGALGKLGIGGGIGSEVWGKIANKVGVEDLAGKLNPVVGGLMFVKKHWKKLAVGLGAGIAGLLSFLAKGAWAGGGALAGGIGGAIGGAKLGAVIGTAIAPGIGTAIGGIIGGIVGFVGGVFAGGWLGLQLQKLWAGLTGKAGLSASQATAATMGELGAGGVTATTIGGTAISMGVAAPVVALGATALMMTYNYFVLSSAFSLPPLEKTAEYINMVEPIYNEDCKQNVACALITFLHANGIERSTSANIGAVKNVVSAWQYPGFNNEEFNKRMQENVAKFGAFQCLAFHLILNPRLPSKEIVYLVDNHPGCIEVDTASIGVGDYIMYPNGPHIMQVSVLRPDRSFVVSHVNTDYNGAFTNTPGDNIDNYVQSKVQAGKRITILRCM